MLFQATVSEWKGSDPQYTYKKKLTSTNTQEWVLNTNKVFKLEVDGSYCKLRYVDNKYGMNSHGNKMKLLETVATVRTAFDATLAHEYLTLNVYPSDDITLSTVARDIPAEDFSQATADNRDSTRSWVWYCEGEWTVRVLCDYTLEEIVDVADTGTTTTTTTTHS